MALLEVKNLRTYIDTDPGPVRAVDDVSFEIAVGETLGLVGESGSGKTMTALSILKLLPSLARIRVGEVWFNGRDLTKLPEIDMPRIRGREISMIFQDPMTSLNPVYSVGFQISEAILAHESLSKAEVAERVVMMMKMVGISSPERRLADYPHEFSGGMRQRIMIAMALACNPLLLIADEPTTALDVTIQAQVLDLMKELRKQVGTSILLITHDLAVIAEMADRVAVMYAGQIVEYTDVVSLFKNPKHPYTERLLKSLPWTSKESSRRLHTVEGTPPDMVNLPSGCRFHPRCGKVMAGCSKDEPSPYLISKGHSARCFLYS